MNFKELFYYFHYALSALLLRRRIPIAAGVPLTDVCNLHCLHCVVANRGRGPYAFQRITEILEEFFRRGARILYLQGGEIFTWSDREKTVHDVIRLARKIGFFKIAVVTNGSFPIEIASDAVWVSLDGPEACHDAIRGKGSFTTTLKNIRQSGHPNIVVNLTINRKNHLGVEELVRFVRGEKNIRGISLNFHTPYPGVEHLALEAGERAAVLESLIRLKQQGYPILNSMHGLKALKSGRYARPVHLIQLMEQDRIFECCWGRQYPGVCEKCGYGVIPELSAIQSLNPVALVAAFQLFRSGKP